MTPAPGSPEDIRQLRQMLDRLIVDIDRLWARAQQFQNQGQGMAIPSNDAVIELPEEEEE